MISRRVQYRLKKARALRTADWAMLVEAWVALAVVWSALRVMSAERLFDHCTALHPKARVDPRQARHVVRRVARLVAMAAGKHVVRMACLPQSLVITRMLARKGICVTVQVGVRRDGAKLLAHAWTEWQGRPITGPGAPLDHYAPLLAAGLPAAVGRSPRKPSNG